MAAPMTEFLDDLRRVIVEALPSTDPQATAARVVDTLRQRWAGEQVYIRQANAQREHALDLIRKGATVAQAARLAGVHVSTVHRWVNDQRERNLQGRREHRGLEGGGKWL